MKKSILLLTIILLNITNTFAQNSTQELKVGDQVPDLDFTNLINSSEKNIKLSNYKGKLVIIDFWATWCAVCLHTLQKLDSLQDQFKDRIVILPITTESKEKVNTLLRNIPQLKTFTYIYDTNLKNYFPYRVVPHEIWIDGDRKIVAITGHDEVTSANINKVLNDVETDVGLKKDIVRDRTKTFLSGYFKDYKLQPDQIVSSSILLRGFEGLGGMVHWGMGKGLNTSFARFTNVPIKNLYKAALIDLVTPTQDSAKFYGKKEFYVTLNSRSIWEAKDSTYFFGTESATRRKSLPYKDQVFHYELIIPLTNSLAFREYMLGDLNRHFGNMLGVEGFREKRKVKCWALTIMGSDSLFITRGGKPFVSLSKGVKSFKVVNQRFDNFMFTWTSYFLPTYFPTPVINETNYDLPVDFDLGDVDPTDFNAVNAGLKKFGLEFKLVERELDMIVIRDVDKKNKVVPVAQ